MFDYPKKESHDETLKKAKKLISKIDKQDVVNAFLYSLSTRELNYRSALGSYYYIKSIPPHKQKNRRSNDTWCEICDWHKVAENPSEESYAYGGLSIYNFERYKWGGVRHDKLDYAKFDLEEFIKLPKVTPTDKDIEILIAILKEAYSLEPKAKAGKYIDKILKAKICSSNKNEMATLLAILGFCDIYNSQSAKGYLHSFHDAYSRDPKELTNDHKYPFSWWTAEDGINSDALLDVFGLTI